jgi:hypothetical protein
MIVRRPSRFVPTAALFALVAASALLASGGALSQAQANTRATLQVEPQCLQGTLFSRAAAPTLSQISRPQGSRIFAAAIPGHWSLAQPARWFQAWRAATPGFDRQIRFGGGRAPPLFL